MTSRKLKSIFALALLLTPLAAAADNKDDFSLSRVDGRPARGRLTRCGGKVRCSVPCTAFRCY
jgi:hypothetical protein